MTGAKVALALEHAFRWDACFVCAGTTALLPVPPGDAAVCAPCVLLVARVVRSASSGALARWFGEEREEPDDLMRRFQEGALAMHRSPADADVLLDLAIAYGEMGLVLDSVFHAAIAIVLAPALREPALPWLLPAAHREPGSLLAIAATARGEGRAASKDGARVPDVRPLRRPPRG